MDIRASRTNDHFVKWIAGILLLIGFGLTDAGVVARCASFLTSIQLGMLLFSYALIAAGLIFTTWEMSKIGHPRNQDR